jgi:hypothetical protein
MADFIYRNAIEMERAARSIFETSGEDAIAAFKGEYPGLLDGLSPAFEKEGFSVDSEQLTVSVWIIRACL